MVTFSAQKMKKVRLCGRALIIKRVRLKTVFFYSKSIQTPICNMKIYSITILAFLTVFCLNHTIAQSNAIAPVQGTTSVSLNPQEPDPNAFILLDNEPRILNLDSVFQNIKYPSKAKSNGIEGKVLTKVLIDENGKYIKHIILKSPDQLLSEALNPEIQHLRFGVATQNNQPIKAWVTVPFSFKLSRQDGYHTNYDNSQGLQAYAKYSNELESPPYPINLREVIDNIGYPEEASKRGIQGTVILKLLIDEKGRYVSHEILQNPNPILTKNVIKHIPTLYFQPGKIEGIPSPQYVSLPFTFNLE